MKSTYIVSITNIKVDKKYYSFKYSISRNGKKLASGTFEDDHCHGDDMGYWEQELMDGYAERLVLIRELE